MTPDWPGVEQAYRDSALTVVEIMALFGITQTQLYHRVRTREVATAPAPSPGHPPRAGDGRTGR